jgi:hypothetical protein
MASTHKILRVASMLIIIASVIGGCTLKYKESNSNTDADSQFVSSSPTNDSIDPANYRPFPYEEMLREIAGLSRQTGISNLREAKLSDSETEIRIWRAGGTFLPVCFILKIQKDAPNAFFVDARAVGDKVVRDKKWSASFAKTVLQPPRSGWKEVISYLKERGIDSRVRLSLDRVLVPAPDQNTIVVEVKQGSQYSMVFYPEFTESQDGHKALDICRRIENEFGTRMGCGG